jgi:hypothetical protein
MAAISEASAAMDVDANVCTQKDLVKLPHDELGGRPLWAVTIEIAFLAGQEAMESALDRAAVAQLSTPRALTGG